ncbi:hypothetical protein GCM10010464_22290 [Pseudonocardia yunnanensis]
MRTRQGPRRLVHPYNVWGFRFGTSALVAHSRPEGTSKKAAPDGRRTGTAAEQKEDADEVE